jgi:MarR family transcriptional regulator, organic hydroperoxide resistance regulator
MNENICGGVSALLVQVARLNRHEGERVLRHAGIRPGQEFVMGALWEEDGQRPGDIARKLGVTAAVLTKHVNNLAEAGFVEAKKHESDGRASRIFLTSRGKALRSEVSTGIDELERNLLATLDESERQVFRDMLERILAGATHIDRF